MECACANTESLRGAAVNAYLTRFLLLRARELGVPLRDIPLVWGALSLVRTVAATPGGHLADRIGHARALAIGFALYAVAYAGFGFGSSPSVALGSLVIYGFYYGLTEGAERALVASLVREDELGRGFGYFNLVTGLLALPASLLFGLALPVRHGALAYGLCVLLSAVSAVGMAVLSQTINPPKEPRPSSP